MFCGHRFSPWLRQATGFAVGLAVEMADAAYLMLREMKNLAYGCGWRRKLLRQAAGALRVRLIVLESMGRTRNDGHDTRPSQKVAHVIWI